MFVRSIRTGDAAGSSSFGAAAQEAPSTEPPATGNNAAPAEDPPTETGSASGASTAPSTAYLAGSFLVLAQDYCPVVYVRHTLSPS